MNSVLSNTFICILTLWSMEHQRTWSRIRGESIVSLDLFRPNEGENDRTLTDSPKQGDTQQKDNKKAAADLKMQPQLGRLKTDEPKRISKYEKPLFSLLETKLRVINAKSARNTKNKGRQKPKIQVQNWNADFKSDEIRKTENTWA